MKNQTKNTCVIYCRVSSENGRQDYSRQLNELTQYANQNGLEIIGTFAEKISGSKKNSERKSLEDALSLAIEAKATLLLSEYTRIGRDANETLKTIIRLRETKTNAYFLKENLCLFNEDGTENQYLLIMASVLSTFSEDEKQRILYRLRSGYAAYREKGGHVGRKGKEEDGWTKDKKTYERDYRELIQKLKERKRHLQAGLRDQRDNLRAIAEDYNVSVNTVQTIRRLFSL